MKVAFRVIGRFDRSAVSARWVRRQHHVDPQVQRKIDETWQQAIARQGIQLFDGPMCRLERYAVGEKLELELSRTSYKIFWGTNLNNPSLADQFGSDVMANPVGLSCALESSDGYLMLGRRNKSVAYYPGKIHPFAGALEPAETVDVFAEVQRELNEELDLQPAELSSMFCIGIIEDLSLRQPELIFHANCVHPRRQIEKMLDPGEHEGVVAIKLPPAQFISALSKSDLTPVALGTAMLWGRSLFGNAWFDAANAAVNLGGHESQ